jgi:hypothetical protein
MEEPENEYSILSNFLVIQYCITEVFGGRGTKYRFFFLSCFLIVSRHFNAKRKVVDGLLHTSRIQIEVVLLKT